MKILIGYDGSSFAIEAIDDLLFAGLPDKCEAVLLTVTDEYYPLLAPGASGVVSEYIALEDVDSSLVSKPLEESLVTAEEGRRLINELFPLWEVKIETHIGSASSAIIEKANAWKPDLIVLGTHGRTGLKRFMLGSVSMKVLSGAHCSVRLARKHDTKAFPLHILVGYDGSEDAEKVITTLETRNFSHDSHIKIVSVIEMFYMTTLPYAAVAVEESLMRSLAEREKSLAEKLETVRDRLIRTYPNTTTEMVRGNPKRALIEAADSFKADELFVGARGMTKLERVFLGSVSHYVAGHSHCTVEVVRT